MADPLYELLAPYFDAQDASPRPLPSDPTVSSYLTRLTTLSLSDLTTTEPASLNQTLQSHLRSLQALSKRSHKAIISASEHLASLREVLPELGNGARSLQDALPQLSSSAESFSQKYSKSIDNAVLERRRKALLLARNADRVSDILDLPTLLSTAVSSSANPSSTATSATINHAAALDLHAHTKRLHALYPNLALVRDIAAQAEQEMKSLSSNLISSLQAQNLKLAAAMRTIGWLRRVAPELSAPLADLALHAKSARGASSVGASSAALGGSDAALGALFLVCRLANLNSMLAALEPLRELADQETSRRLGASGASHAPPPPPPPPTAETGSGGSNAAWSGGQQTERYLKRYVELFREQSFAVVSMYQSIFPSALPAPSTVMATAAAAPNGVGGDRTAPRDAGADRQDPLRPLPDPLATFALHLVDLLAATLRTYLPNVRDRAARDSLLTQVLYCAGSLGRLGGEFGMMLALLEEDARLEEKSAGDGSDGDGEEEWVDVIKKHRVQASRLEVLASGVGGVRSGTTAGVG